MKCFAVLLYSDLFLSKRRFLISLIPNLILNLKNIISKVKVYFMIKSYPVMMLFDDYYVVSVKFYELLFGQIVFLCLIVVLFAFCRAFPCPTYHGSCRATANVSVYNFDEALQSSLEDEDFSEHFLSHIRDLEKKRHLKDGITEDPKKSNIDYNFIQLHKNYTLDLFIKVINSTLSNKEDNRILEKYVFSCCLKYYLVWISVPISFLYGIIRLAHIAILSNLRSIENQISRKTRLIASLTGEHIR